MTLVEHALLLVHVIGWAALFGALVAQAREPVRTVTWAMRDGAGTAFVAGLLLVGVLEAGTEPVDHVKVGVKFAVGLVILVLVMANLRRERLPSGVFWGLLGLTVANMAVAIVW